MGVSRTTVRPKVEEPKDGIIQVRVLNRKDETVTHRTYYGTPTSYTRKTLFGVPFILQIPNKITYADLYRQALHQLQRFLKVRAVAATPPTSLTMVRRTHLLSVLSVRLPGHAR
jgi:hypothetical protein